ncbi:hypothetical protein [Microbacterium sp. MYb64]|uniref:hypothetical protein n=1 Tax=Microbacterium sp. MYb64 TaxID=1848691 RepID=UPI0011AFF82D|nr:hypothetical protein [Microbacterium sp. MYb64]
MTEETERPGMGWAVARVINDGRERKLEHIRELSEAEYAEVEAALRLVNWCTQGSKWNDLAESWQQLTVATSENPIHLEKINIALFSALRALSLYSEPFAAAPPEIAMLAEDVEAKGGSQWINLSRGMRSRSLVDSTPLVTLEARSSRPGQVRKELILTPTALKWLGIPGDGGITLNEGVSQFTNAAHAYQYSLLRAVSHEVSSAVLVIKRLAAEVALGFPALLRISPNDDGTQGIEIQDLSLPDLPLLSVAISRAIDVSSTIPGSNSPAPARSQREPDIDAEIDAPPPILPEQQQDTHAGSEGNPEPPISEDHLAAVPTWEALDLVGLFLTSTTLARKTERRWSRALAEAITDESIAYDLDQWFALISSEWARIDSSDDESTITWPPGPEILAALDEDDPLAFRLGYIAAFEALTHSLDTLSQPTSAEIIITDDQARLDYWWTSGGFTMLRDGASLLLRVGQAIPASDAGNMGIQSEWKRPAHEVWLECAQRASVVGLPEATLTYSLYAFDAWDERPETLHPPQRQAALDAFMAMAPKARALVNGRNSEPPSLPITVAIAALMVQCLSAAMSAAEVRLTRSEES